VDEEDAGTELMKTVMTKGCEQEELSSVGWRGGKRCSMSEKMIILFYFHFSFLTSHQNLPHRQRLNVCLF